MGPEIFAEWMTRQGHHVLRSASSYWCNHGPRIYQAFPYHWLIRPSDEELRTLCLHRGALGLRFSLPADAPSGCVSYHAILEGTTYELETLGKWARKNVRRGLQNCRVEPLALTRLAEEGWALQRDTLERQGRRVGMTAAHWRRHCLSAADLPGFAAWGAFVGEQLAASVITFRMEECIYMLSQQCRRDYLREHVNNALSFVVTREMIGRPGVRSIFYSLHSLDAPPAVDEFKFRMGYQAKPVRQQVVFHPLVAPFANPISHAALRAMLRLRPGLAPLAKAEGLLRFYRESRLPASRQAIPVALRDNGNLVPEEVRSL